MSSSGKLVLCLAVIFCVVQMISARPRADGMLLENVRYDLEKKCAGVEKDMEKEMNNVMHKLAKESAKLSKKATKEDSQECIDTAKLQAEEELEEKNQEAQECIQDLRNALEATLSPETSVRDIMLFRQDFKNKLQICKKSAKMNMKTIQNQFSLAGRKC